MEDTGGFCQKKDTERLNVIIWKKNRPVQKVIDPNTGEEREAIIKVKGRDTGVAAKNRDDQLQSKKEGTGNTYKHSRRN